MKGLDMHTLFVTHLCIDLICMLLILSLWRQNRHRFDGLGLLALTFVTQSLGLLLIAFRGTIPDALSIVAANIILVSGVLIGYMGLERFLEKPGPQFHNYLLLTAYAGCQAYFTYTQPDFVTRAFLYSLATTLLSLQALWLLLYRIGREFRRYAAGVSLFFALFCAVNGLRIADFILQPHSTDHLFNTGAFQALILLTFQLLFILLTYSLTLMVNRRLLADIRTQEEKFTKAFHSSPYAVLLTRVSDGRIVEANQGFTEATGYERSEALGRTTRELGLWMDEREREMMIATLSSDGSVRGMVFQFRRKNGEPLFGATHAEPLQIQDEMFILASVNDITRRKQAEMALQELNLDLQRRIDEETNRRLVHERILANNARLAAMGRMIGAIAHQWRQPLATLGMMVQRVHAQGTRQPLSAEQWDEFRQGALRQIKYMSETIDEFRNFYRHEKEPEAFLPHLCVADAVKLFATQFNSSGIQVEVTCPEEARRPVSGYPNEFKQVMLNLLANARDAILEARAHAGKPELGRIVIELSVPTGRDVFIDVADNGCGIPADIAARIFESYFTTKEETGGSGIGLYMSRMIVEESLKGRLSLLAGEGGAVFRIELPLGESQ